MLGAPQDLLRYFLKYPKGVQLLYETYVWFVRLKLKQASFFPLCQM